MSPDGVARLLRSIIPDPFVIAIGLTAAAFAVALVFSVIWGEGTPMELVQAWVSGWTPEGAPANARPIGGLWSLLTFAMQMCLILVTGFVVANTRPVQRILGALAWFATGPRTAIVLVASVAMSLALVNWGVGLIAGALLAREVGFSLKEKGIKAHYPLLAAAGYLGLAVWHGGLSGSAPLKVTSKANLDEVLGSALSAHIDVLPLTATILSPRNLIVTLCVAIVMTSILVWLVPKDPASRTEAPDRPASNADEESWAPGIAGRLERSPWVSGILVVLITAWFVPWLWQGGWRALSPDSMNLCFLGVGLALAGGPVAYMRHAKRGAEACAGIIVQFPLYGGILGILAAGGLVGLIADALPTSAWGLSLSTFLSAGLVNLFVPSGGGQWTVQGPMVMQAAAKSGVDPGRVVLALAWGDQWTNLFQPFWALPLLGITGTKAGDLLGPTMLAGVGAGVVFAAGAALF
ncbi:MAG: TIGR00366 family protein [Myxococcota bacterium]